MRMKPQIIFLPIFAVLSLFPASAQYNINTFAGGGPPNGLPATSVAIGHVKAAVVDVTGNVYITDPDGNRVYKVDLSGVATVVAGNGGQGFSGDGGPATSAALYGPSGVAVDSAGNLYIADTQNNRVRKVSGGVITTVAGNGTGGDGGPAVSAALNSPTGLAVDSADNLYLADTSNNRIRKVSGGIISTVAGNGTSGFSGDGGSATSAQLNGPTGIAVDLAGNLYIADTVNLRIRRVSGGTITTVAGNGTSGYSGDGGPSINAQLRYPSGVRVDTAGNLYIADTYNHSIRKVTAGIITTVAGNGTFGFSGDGGPANNAQLNAPGDIGVNSAGSLYIADTNNHRIRKVSAGVITTVAGNDSYGLSGNGGAAASAQLYRPRGVALDSGGNLYIADSFNNSVREVSGGVITAVAGNGTAGYSGDGGPAPNAQLNGALGVAADSAGNLYIADTYNNRIRKVFAGTITTVAGNGTAGYSGDGGAATSAQIGFSFGIAADSAGNLYIADTSNNRIRKVSGGVITTVAGNGAAGFSGDGGPAGSASLSSPQGVAVDGTGNLYIADSGNNRIRKVSAGVITTVAGNGTCCYSGDGGPATGAQINNPVGAAVDSAGNLYIMDWGNNRIRKVSAGVITTVAGNGTGGFSGDGGPATSAQLNAPSSITADSAGNLYFADSNNNRIRRLTAAPPVSITIATSPSGLSIVVDNNTYTAPQTFSWIIGSSHTVSLPTPQAGGAGTRYAFAAWADGPASNPRTILTPAGSATYTANFNPQYQLNITVSPANTGTASPSGGFYNSGAPVQLIAFPNLGYQFTGWSGDLSGNANPATIVMSAPRSVSANFGVLGVSYTISGQVTFSGAGLSGVTVAIRGSQNGSTVTNGAGFYTLSGVAPGGNYNVTPSAAGYSFNPVTVTFSNLSGNQTANFTAQVSPALQFYPIAPCRVADTRSFTGPPGPLGPPSLTAGSSRSFPVLSSPCGIPASAVAYSLNVSAVPLTNYLQYVTVWGTGQFQPIASTLNSWDGRLVANAAIIPAGTGGAISIFASDPTDVFFDINGYFAPPGVGGLQFYPMTPCRVADTRSFTGPPGPLGPPSMTAGSTRSFPVLSSACGIPASAVAYSLNMSAVPINNYLQYLTAWGTGHYQPIASTLNSWTGTIVANAAIVPAGTGGAISIFVSDATDVFFDINGYFAPPGTGGLQYHQMNPCRVADTRAFTGPPGPLGPPSMTAGSARSFPVLSSACGIPSVAAAYAFNVTAAPTAGYLQYLTTWGTGQPQPIASTLNSWTGTIVPNAAFVPAGTSGAISIFVSDPTDVFFDINGYFAP